MITGVSNDNSLAEKIVKQRCLQQLVQVYAYKYYTYTYCIWIYILMCGPENNIENDTRDVTPDSSNIWLRKHMITVEQL